MEERRAADETPRNWIARAWRWLQTNPWGLTILVLLLILLVVVSVGIGFKLEKSDWVALFSGIGTWAVGVLAIWGDQIRSLFGFSPQLRIKQIGLGKPVDQKHAEQKMRTARYYYLSVENTVRLPAAHETRFLITRVEKRGPDGQPIVVFAEKVQLSWVRGEVYPLARTIGPDAEANLLWIGDDGAFQFELAGGTPFHFPPPTLKQPVLFWVTVQAQSIEADSPALRLRVEWNARWVEGDQDHLVVTPDPPHQLAS